VNRTLFQHLVQPAFGRFELFRVAYGSGNYELPWKDNELGARRKLLRVRICMLGSDVTEYDFETVRNLLQVLTWAVPSADMDFAATYDECTLGVYVVDTPNVPYGWDSRDTIENYWRFEIDVTSGEYKYWPYGFETSSGALVRVSNQGDNRHTMTHELGHAMGLQHIPVQGSSMSAGNAQLPYWSALDIATIAAIQDSRVQTTDTTLDGVCTALGVNGCTTDIDGWSNVTMHAAWEEVAMWLCSQTFSKKCHM
jgi:hypothetical protein